MKTMLYWCHRLLIWLLIGAVAVLVVPVTLQIISRYTDLIKENMNFVEAMCRLN